MSGSAALRPRLLFLSQTLPFPPDGGVNIRTYHTLRLLAEEFDITALCFYRRQDRSSRAAVDAAIAGLRGFARLEAFAIPQEYQRLRYLRDHASSVVRRRAYTVDAYASKAFRARLESLLARDDFALVHVDSLDLAGYLPLLTGLPVVCTHHNVESQLLRRRGQLERAPWRRAYLAWQAERVEDLERTWCPRVALNITVSEADREELSRRAPGARFVVVPNGVDTAGFRPEQGREDGLVYVGGANWFPNRDALAHFCEDILPLLRRGREHVAVRWVGRVSDDDRRRSAARYDIELPGYVEDVRPYIKDAACYIVPLRVGGGTRLKILDAWAMGKAVVSTAVGCEGLTAVDGENILVRDSAPAFAEAVRAVIANGDLRERLGRRGRETVERLYDWEVIRPRLLDAYRSVVGAGCESTTLDA
ncbi:MAG: glycosyltransferase family 4 protein [Longimicrobiales bacterium]